MSLQSMLGSLTQRFRMTTLTATKAYTPSMLLARSMSTNKPFQNAVKNSNNNNNTDDASFPSILAGNLQEPREFPISLEAYEGRSISNVSNVNNAYRRLNSILMQNNVRRELRANMYYEKPNVARRRKNIERNRKLFGAMVRKKVALIMQMKQRGM